MDIKFVHHTAMILFVLIVIGSRQSRYMECHPNMNKTRNDTIVSFLVIYALKVALNVLNVWGVGSVGRLLQLISMSHY